MPYGFNGTDLLQQIEWVPGNQKTHHKIASSGYKINGQTLAAAGKAPVTALDVINSSYIYKGERFQAGAEGTSYGVNCIWGYGLNGARDATHFTFFQKVGCRPRMEMQLYHQTSAGTYYINRFLDGEVWVSTSQNSRSGTKISNSIASMTYPRGLLYIMLRIVGGGGRGGNGTLPWNVGAGGGGGATAVCCIRLPVNSYAAVVVGGQNSASSISCGSFSCTANGGGNGGSGSSSGGGGGSVSGSAQNADGILLASASGGSGGGYYDGGGSSGISFTDYAPEGGTVAWSQSGGGSGSGTGGGGGASTIGQGGKTANGSLSTNGSQGNGPGAGGSGGNYSSGTGAAGLPGALTIWY